MVARRFLIWIAALAVALAFTAGDRVLADSVAAESPEDFILKISAEANELMTTDEARDGDIDITALEDLVYEAVDLRRVGFFSLGKYARQLSPEQKAEFDELFPKFAVRRYVRLLLRYGGQEMVLRNSLQRSARDTIVWTRVLGDPEFDGLILQWRVLRDRDGAYSLLDVGTEGIWLAIQQREEFTSIIDNNGGIRRGGIEHLLNTMRSEVGGAS